MTSLLSTFGPSIIIPHRTMNHHPSPDHPSSCLTGPSPSCLRHSIAGFNRLCSSIMLHPTATTTLCLQDPPLDDVAQDPYRRVHRLPPIPQPLAPVP
eukprot:CAMPEP_0173443878 /NCGR_PEP_ID=MMETSP1357-20121228/30993_1 /TAXON_ID=77926 /ORGANISM="Hemiselmis rufescens, Strain PCC563" /LENGTH=96 /DNA_ID=CAMNT_0014409855 /DNA_START=12 /DNA_END=299 /DNA_ORIENTATION=+